MTPTDVWLSLVNKRASMNFLYKPLVDSHRRVLPGAFHAILTFVISRFRLETLCLAAKLAETLLVFGAGILDIAISDFGAALQPPVDPSLGGV